MTQGYSQVSDLNYDETFGPVARSESICLVIALASKNGLKMHQLDVTTAFLNGGLEEEMYDKQPEGFVVEGQEHLVCKPKRSLYELNPLTANDALPNYPSTAEALNAVT